MKEPLLEMLLDLVRAVAAIQINEALGNKIDGKYYEDANLKAMAVSARIMRKDFN